MRSSTPPPHLLITSSPHQLAKTGAGAGLEVGDDKVDAGAALPRVELRREGEAAGTALRHQLLDPFGHIEGDRLQHRATLADAEAKVALALADDARLALDL